MARGVAASLIGGLLRRAPGGRRETASGGRPGELRHTSMRYEPQVCRRVKADGDALSPPLRDPPGTLSTPMRVRQRRCRPQSRAGQSSSLEVETAGQRPWSSPLPVEKQTCCPRSTRDGDVQRTQACQAARNPAVPGSAHRRCQACHWTGGHRDGSGKPSRRESPWAHIPHPPQAESLWPGKAVEGSPGLPDKRVARSGVRLPASGTRTRGRERRARRGWDRWRRP